MKWILLGLSLPLSALATATSYYYAFPQAAGPEWGYGFPECKVHIFKTKSECDQAVQFIYGADQD